MWEAKYFTARKSDSGKFHSLHTLNVNLDLIHEKYSALGEEKKNFSRYTCTNRNKR